jgi:hypothetical protein
MDLQVRPTRRPQVLSQGVPDKLVLLTPDDGSYFALNDVGARVWELCDGTRSVRDIVATVADEFDAPITVIEVDVVELLDDLASERLVEAT